MASSNIFSSSLGTPSAMWKRLGGDDPHGDDYDCPRQELALGNMGSCCLADRLLLFLDYSENVDYRLSKLNYIMSIKDRIRWLSRILSGLESEIVREANNVARGWQLMGSYSDDALAYAVAVDGNHRDIGKDICLAAVSRIHWLVGRISKYTD